MISFPKLMIGFAWRTSRCDWGCHITQVRNSIYPPSYIEPIFKRQELDELFKEDRIGDRAFLPVKAARIDESCSLFRDDLVNKFTNIVMDGGRKALARHLITQTFEAIKSHQIEKYHKASNDEKRKIILDPLDIFHAAIINCKPLLNLASIKRGAIVYQVPIPVSDNNARFQAMRWIVQAAKDREKRKIRFPEKLAYELIDASKNEGRVVKRKQDLHKQCEANKAYAHFRWG